MSIPFSVTKEYSPVDTAAVDLLLAEEIAAGRRQDDG